MDKNSRGDPRQSSSFSWMLDNNNRPQHSQWLQTTLAELDWKIKKILEVAEDNGDTFAPRAEMYYQKRPELIKMVEDLHKSYRALADKYDLVQRSESLRAPNCSGSNSNSFGQIRHNYSNSGLILEPPDSVSECQEHQNCSSDEDVTSVCCKSPNMEKKVTTGVNKSEDTGRDHEHCYDWEKVKEKDGPEAAGFEKEGRDELLLEISKLIEQTGSQQAELIKRYNKTRYDLKQLMNENRRLRDQLAQCKINVIKRATSNSKWKGSFCGKLLP